MASKYQQLIDECRPVFTGDYPTPILKLATPAKKGIGFIGNIYDVNMTLRFNAMSELSFSVPQKYHIGGKWIECPMFSDIRKDMLIYAVGYGWFVIVQSETTGDGIKTEKQVTAYSYEYTLSNLGSGSIGSDQSGQNRTYLALAQELPADTAERVSPQNSGDGSLGKTLTGYIADVLSGSWTFGYINSIFQGKKSGKKIVRAITGDPSKNLYDFMMNDLEQAFGCYFVFDTTRFLIHILADEDFEGDSPSILLSYQNLIQNTTIMEEDKEIITALSVTGENGITVSEVNPAGGAVLYDFSYYYDWMSDGLKNALTNWHEDLKDANDEKDFTVGKYDYRYHHKRLTKTIVGLYRLREQFANRLAYYRQELAAWQEKLKMEAASPTSPNSYQIALSAVESYAKAVAIFSDGQKDTFQNPSGTDIVWYTGDTDKRYRMIVPGYYISTYGNVYKIDQAIEKLCGSGNGQIVRVPLELYTFVQPDNPIHQNQTTHLFSVTTPQWGMYLQLTYRGYPLYCESYANSTPELDDYVGVYHLEPYFDTITLSDYQAKFSLKSYLDRINPALYTELFPFIHEDNYENTDYALYDNMITDKMFEVKDGLLEEGRNELALRCQPTISFSIDLYNPLCLAKFAPYAEHVFVGCPVLAEVQSGVWAKIRLMEIPIDFQNKESLQAVCGNTNRLNSSEFTFREFFCNEADKKQNTLNDPLKTSFSRLTQSFGWY